MYWGEIGSVEESERGRVRAVMQATWAYKYSYAHRSAWKPLNKCIWLATERQRHGATVRWVEGHSVALNNITKTNARRKSSRPCANVYRKRTSGHNRTSTMNKSERERKQETKLNWSDYREYSRNIPRLRMLIRCCVLGRSRSVSSIDRL